jgi:thiamine biosynthesis lipoprotein
MTATLTRRPHVEHVMGTAVTFDLRDDDAAPGALAAAVAWLHEVDARFSPYRPDSEVCRYDRGELRLDAASADLRRVAACCERLRRETGGFFDPYASGPFDPSAFVKGWAVQAAADQLRTAGLQRFCINAGGDVVAHGRPDEEHAWRVGIRHPDDAHAVACVVDAGDGLAVATSGLYERGEHILDPGTGDAPRDVVSVTVTGPDLGLADAYATAAFAMGARGPAWTLGLDGYEAMTILSDDTVLMTPRFPQVTA